MTRLRIRAFVGPALLFQERVEVEDGDLEALAERHMKMLASHPIHMLEFEFLDELDPQQRYLRFGTDPGRMRNPVAFDLGRFAARRIRKV